MFPEYEFGICTKKMKLLSKYIFRRKYAGNQKQQNVHHTDGVQNMKVIPNTIPTLNIPLPGVTWSVGKGDNSDQRVSEVLLKGTILKGKIFFLWVRKGWWWGNGGIVVSVGKESKFSPFIRVALLRRKSYTKEVNSFLLGLSPFENRNQNLSLTHSLSLSLLDVSIYLNSCWHMRLTKIQISMRIHAFWSVSVVRTKNYFHPWLSKMCFGKILIAQDDLNLGQSYDFWRCGSFRTWRPSEDSDQTAHVHLLGQILSRQGLFLTRKVLITTTPDNIFIFFFSVFWYFSL